MELDHFAAHLRNLLGREMLFILELTQNERHQGTLACGQGVQSGLLQVFRHKIVNTITRSYRADRQKSALGEVLVT